MENSTPKTEESVQIQLPDLSRIFQNQSRDWMSVEQFEVLELDIARSSDDWQQPIKNYLRNPSVKTSRRIRMQSTKYVLLEGILYRRTKEGLLLRCVNKEEARRSMQEMHAGSCGYHQAGPKLCLMIRRHGHYWPTMQKDCIDFAKKCVQCQRHGPVHRAPATE